MDALLDCQPSHNEAMKEAAINMNADFGHELRDDGGNDRQARIDGLVEWFLENYEDPADSVPYESARGGYQWFQGGPCYTREQLAAKFSGVSDEIIEAAVERIEFNGLNEWALVVREDDHIDGNEPQC